MPFDAKPQGSAAAGCWVKLNGYVNGDHSHQRVIPLPKGTSWPTSNAVSGSCGVIRRS